MRAGTHLGYRSLELKINNEGGGGVCGGRGDDGGIRVLAGGLAEVEHNCKAVLCHRRERGIGACRPELAIGHTIEGVGYVLGE